MKEEDQKALIRGEVIMQELRGEITATEAAAQLGMSRKTYYQWQKRAVEALMEGVSEKPRGRPKKEIDPEKEQLKSEVQQLREEREILNMRLKIHEILEDVSEEDRMAILYNKKTRNQRKRSRKKKQTASETGNNQSDR